MYTLKSSEFRFKNYLHKITGGKAAVSAIPWSEGRKSGGWCWEPAGWGTGSGSWGVECTSVERVMEAQRGAVSCRVAGEEYRASSL